MKRGFLLAGLLLLCVSLQAATTPGNAQVVQQMNSMPLAFTKNMGQWDERVLFRASAGGATMWFMKEGVTYQFTRHMTAGAALVAAGDRNQNAVMAGDRKGRPYNPDERDSVEQLVLTAKFVGANANPEVIGEGLMEYKCNYFLGNDPTKWHTDVPNYDAITLKGIYPGIDLRFSGVGNGQAAYEFISAPGADIAQIKVTYEGTEETSIDVDGRMVVKTKWGDMIAAIRSPANGALPGTSSFSQSLDKTIGFEGNGSSQQALGPLAIGLVYSTFLGGSYDDVGDDIAVDSSGCAYVTGYTMSSDFPTTNGYDTSFIGGYYDVIITKFSAAGNSLVYSTFLAGTSSDFGSGIAIDSSGCVYVTGATNSPDFPTLNAYDATNGGSSDAFLAKISATGNALVYSTFLGGSAWDNGDDVAVDRFGFAYVAGETGSSDFSTQNAVDNSYGGGIDAFVAKFSTGGNSLVYSTYLGGPGEDRGEDIAVDGYGCAYVAGKTRSSNFPTYNPFDASLDGFSDAFVTKFSAAGNSLVYSTFLGGSEFDDGRGIAVDAYGCAYVTGTTYSPDFPTLNAYDSSYNQFDAFIIKLSSAGNSLVYGTFLGGSSAEESRAIVIDGFGCAYVSGSTWSSDFPTKNAYDVNFHGGDVSDVFVAKLSAVGNSLEYSTYLGGSGAEDGLGIAVNNHGCAFVTGYTQSPDFPTMLAYDANSGSYMDAFVTKLTVTTARCGDANGDGAVDILDAVYLIAYIFSGGSAPSPLLAGDANCDGSVDISDTVYLIAYIFGGGPAPCAGCK